MTIRELTDRLYVGAEQFQRYLAKGGGGRQLDRMPASYRSPALSETVYASCVNRQPWSDQRQRYHSVSGHDESWCSSTSASDDEDLMTSSSPSHVIGVTSSSPPRQLSVSELFTFQRPRQSQPGLLSVAAALPDQHRPTVNMAATADHVMLSYWPETETKNDAEQRRSRRLPASSSFDDSAIDNQSAPSTSSGGSRGHNGGSRINQSGLSTSSAGSRCHAGSSSGVCGHLTRSVAVIRCPSDDVTPKYGCTAAR